MTSSASERALRARLGGLSKWAKTSNRSAATLPAHMLRVAAIFELINDPEATRISGDSMKRAFAVYRWLRDEAHKAMTVTSGDQITAEVEREALEWIARQRAKDRAAKREPMELIAARELKRGPRKFRVMEREEVEAALMQLEAGGWLARTDSAGRTDAQTKWQIRWDFEAVWTP